ncbi:MAG: hypothetical protein LBI33_09720 [Propionibacteriaceae bacterium]|jgi:hypothetical protein|nr:hypothetical protein [Propionibacteriaceae bacterium]
MFDDALLDDPAALAARGERLRWLALAGARLRQEDTEDGASVATSLALTSPRSVLLIGEEARLVRTLVEPHCPVPCVAWPLSVLPPWAGPLDFVIVLAGTDSGPLATCLEAIRRGAVVFVVAPQGSPILDAAGPAAAWVTAGDDPFVAALLALKTLATLGLGPGFTLEAAADVLDCVAEECGPRYGLEVNPAKNLACALADAVPLVWGSTAPAARAAGRVAAALRAATGLPGFAADVAGLLPLVATAPVRDVFADPFEDGVTRPAFCLLGLDDGEDPVGGAELERLALDRGVRAETIRFAHDNPVLRYAGLTQHGLFAAAYLGLATIKE